MSSYIKKHCRSISRRISQVGPMKVPSETKSSSKIPPSETSTVETRDDHQFQKSPQSRKDPSPEKTSSKSPIFHIEKANTTPSAPSKAKNPQHESISSSEDVTIIDTPIANTSYTTHSPNTLPNTIPNTLLTTTTTKSNKNGPDEKYQINSHLLFEHFFPGQTYISVHLQRLQHGLYSDSNMHTKQPLHVTFVALSFVFHASTPAHRFESAVIEIKVTDKTGTREREAEGKGGGEDTLRILKYAPHQAYGRISTESLKWNFQLGASLGVSQGPAKICVNPRVSEEKSRVVGTMMKIQGSTRSTFHKSTRYPDTLLHFSLEENSQQESGLPREFTFVFLVERPSKKQYPPIHTVNFPSIVKTMEHRISEKLRGLNEMSDVKKDEEECMKYTSEDLAGEQKTARERLDGPLEEVFGDVEFEVSIEPKVSNTLQLPTITNTPHSEHTVITCEVGQKFPTEGTADSVGKMEHPDSMVGGRYNFAKLGGAFEEQVSLPGESVGSRVPDVSDVCAGGGGGGGGNKEMLM
ncbi:hypothetical protein SBOR_8338 [Sclerotinia borealis F-4128]|uniref:Uncharacterized protein n=1 Tax=Sclerotinia borealis (strain F-4128) TaxID=1432307 RepID=W9C5W7_SCLBF|nr:hypothetical protein SBOR_8338 [Sclerotinia borealis F-4128]